MSTEKYKESTNNLIKAIDIAINVFQEFPPKGFDPKQIEHFISVYRDNKKSILNAEPKFQTLSSLKYEIENVFIFFQESSGVTINKFWKRIKSAGLPYERINKIEKILKHNKITNDFEYNYIIDTIVPFQQEGIFNPDNIDQLNLMLKAYEVKKKS